MQASVDTTTARMRRSILGVSVILAMVFVTLGTAFQALAAPDGSDLRASPPSGHFGAVAVGECDFVTLEGCKVRTFKLTNVGSEPLVIAAYGITGVAAGLVEPRTCDDFIEPGIGIVLEPKQSCVLSVAMSPPEAGPAASALRILSPTDEIILEVPLFATGVIR